MPKKLEDLKNAKVGVQFHGGKKIDFKPVIAKIIASGQYYGVKEVYEGKDLVNKKVSRFRTKKLLDNAHNAGQLMRLYDEGKFMYGKIVKFPQSATA